MAYGVMARKSTLLRSLFFFTLGLFLASQIQGQVSKVEVKFALGKYATDEDANFLSVSLNASGLPDLNCGSPVNVTVGLANVRFNATPIDLSRQGAGDFILDINTLSNDPFTVTFQPNSEVSSSHQIHLVSDNLYEGDESFYLEITNISASKSCAGRIQIGTPSRVQVEIEDNDVLRVNFTQAHIFVKEGEKAMVTGQIHMSTFEKSLQFGLICFELEQHKFLQPALENVDFNPEGPTGRYRLVFEDIFFRPPITSEEVGIQTIDDSISEPTESFTCALRLTVNPLDPIQSTHPDTVLISIIDDDSVPSCPSTVEAVSLNDNDGVRVSWEQPPDSPPVTYTTVTYCNTSQSCEIRTCTSSPCIIEGLGPGTEYHFTVTPSNNHGNAVGCTGNRATARTTCSVTPNGTIWLDCGSQQMFSCCVSGQAAVWAISGLDGMNTITNQSGQDAANFPRITTTDNGVTHSSIIIISRFTIADNGAIVECTDSSTNEVNGMANILVVVPLCPSGVVAVAHDDNDTITVSWEQPPDSPPVTSTTVTFCPTSSPNCGKSVNCTSPCTFRGLDPDTEYQFTVVPNNNCASRTGCPGSSVTAQITTCTCRGCISQPASILSSIIPAPVVAVVLLMTIIVSVIVAILITRRCYNSKNASQKTPIANVEEVYEEIEMTDSPAYGTGEQEPDMYI